MQTAPRSAAFVHHVLTLLLGVVLAAGIWVTGHAELSWLGFAVATVYAEGRGGRRARAGCRRSIA